MPTPTPSPLPTVWHKTASKQSPSRCDRCAWLCFRFGFPSHINLKSRLEAFPFSFPRYRLGRSRCSHKVFRWINKAMLLVKGWLPSFGSNKMLIHSCNSRLYLGITQGRSLYLRPGLYSSHLVSTPEVSLPDSSGSHIGGALCVPCRSRCVEQREDDSTDGYTKVAQFFSLCSKSTCLI